MSPTTLPAHRHAVPGLRRNMVTICAMTATIMQALDTTIANVALPYMQGTLSASQDQINWVLTSYIVAAAIMTAPVGWIANRFGRKRIFIICSAGFTIASVLCGLAQDINQMVLFRLLQGVFGAALVPLSQAVMLDSYSAAGTRQGDVDLGHGRDDGPDHGAVTRRLADRDLFLALGVLRQPAVRHLHRARPHDLHGRDQEEPRTCASTGSASPRWRSRIGSLQLALDRGEQLGWLESNEIIAEFIVSGHRLLLFLRPFADDSTAVHPVRAVQGQELRRRLRVHGGDGPGAVLDHGAVLAVPAERDRLSHHHRGRCCWRAAAAAPSSP